MSATQTRPPIHTSMLAFKSESSQPVDQIHHMVPTCIYEAQCFAFHRHFQVFHLFTSYKPLSFLSPLFVRVNLSTSTSSRTLFRVLRFIAFHLCSSAMPGVTGAIHTAFRWVTTCNSCNLGPMISRLVAIRDSSQWSPLFSECHVKRRFARFCCPPAACCMNRRIHDQMGKVPGCHIKKLFVKL